MQNMSQLLVEANTAQSNIIALMESQIANLKSQLALSEKINSALVKQVNEQDDIIVLLKKKALRNYA
jgi:hypothetical protein